MQIGLRDLIIKNNQTALLLAPDISYLPAGLYLSKAQAVSPQRKHAGCRVFSEVPMLHVGSHQLPGHGTDQATWHEDIPHTPVTQETSGPTAHSRKRSSLAALDLCDPVMIHVLLRITSISSEKNFLLPSSYHIHYFHYIFIETSLSTSTKQTLKILNFPSMHPARNTCTFLCLRRAGQTQRGAHSVGGISGAAQTGQTKAAEHKAQDESFLFHSWAAE